MKSELVHSLTDTFEGHAQQTDSGVEYWLARDLQHLLGYADWRNFGTVISKAKVACEVSGHPITDHFVDVNKMVELGSGGQREVDDIMLTRYACYLLTQNGDPKKQEIAFTQTYFAVQTRRAELIEQRLLDAERVSARKKLSVTEKKLSDVIFEHPAATMIHALQLTAPLSSVNISMAALAILTVWKNLNAPAGWICKRKTAPFSSGYAI